MTNPRKRLLPWGIGKTIDSIKKIDDRGLLYYLDYKADYYKLEKYVALVANTKPGCSTFFTRNENNEAILGRNYDFNHYRYNKKGEDKDITSLIIVTRCANPKAKYKSVGVVDGFWLDFDKGRYFEGAPSDGETDMTRIAMAPFVIMDGVNEAGLATSIMHLPCENDWQEIEYRDPDTLTDKEKEIAIIYEEENKRPDRYDFKVKNNALCINTVDHLTWKANKNLAVNQNEPNKESIMHPVLMRKMLDYCKDVDEAIELAKTYNLKSPMTDNDYHIMLADKTGKSVILEWINNKLVVNNRNYGTNYYLGREDHFGYGQDRDEVLTKKLKDKMTYKETIDLLEEVSQNPFKKQYVGFTEWSSVYNLDKGKLDISIFLDYTKNYEYKI